MPFCRWIPLLAHYMLPEDRAMIPELEDKKHGALRVLGSTSVFYQWLKQRMGLACPEWVSSWWASTHGSLWLPPSRVWVQESQMKASPSVALWQEFYHPWGRHLRLLEYLEQGVSADCLVSLPFEMRVQCLQEAMRWVQHRRADYLYAHRRSLSKTWDAFSMWVQDSETEAWHGVLKQLGFRFIMRQVQMVLPHPERLLQPDLLLGEAPSEPFVTETGSITWVPPKERRRLLRQLQTLLVGASDAQAGQTLWMSTSFWRVLGYMYWLDPWLGAALDEKREVVIGHPVSFTTHTPPLRPLWCTKPAMVSWWKVQTSPVQEVTLSETNTSWCVGTYEPETGVMSVDVLPLVFMGLEQASSHWMPSDHSGTREHLWDMTHVQTLIVGLTRRLLTQYPITYIQWRFPLMDKPNQPDHHRIFLQLAETLHPQGIALEVQTERLFVKESLQVLKSPSLQQGAIALWLQRWWGLEGMASRMRHSFNTWHGRLSQLKQPQAFHASRGEMS
ncbi:MAG: hypothetical protein ACKO37_06225 [Vampirovibrionales bacterium]